MSVSNETVKQAYQGNGATTSFAIPCAFIPSDASNEIKVYKISTAGVLTLQVEGAMNDYTLSPAYNAVSNPNGPSNVVFNVAPASTVKVLITRYLPIKQIVSYINSGAFVAKSHEMGMDRMTFMIQQIVDMVGRSSQFSIVDELRGFNPIVPVMPTYPATLRTNDTQTAWQWVPLDPGGSAGSVPAGGGVGAALVKTNATDYQMQWADLVFSGISALTGAQFDAIGLVDALTKIIRITYTPPQVSLSAAGSGTLREKGTTVTNVALAASVTKKSDPIAMVKFYKDGSLINTVASPNPAGGVENYAWVGSFTDTVVFRADVTDSGATGGPTTVQSSQTFSYVYPYFVGAGAVGANVAAVQAMTKLVISSTATLVRSITATGGQVFYFAYPVAYGALTSILDVNNFETISDWTRTTRSFTGLDATSQSYYVYEFNNPVLAGSYQYTFKR